MKLDVTGKAVAANIKPEQSIHRSFSLKHILFRESTHLVFLLMS